MSYSCPYHSHGWFFALRAVRIARLLEHETPQQRSTRLSRTAQPPMISARVFKWTESPSGQYIEEEIPKRLREEILDYYSSEQSCYDPVLNEWHCCALWGEYHSDYDQDDFNFLYSTFEGDDHPVEEAVAPPNPNLPFDDSPVEDLLLSNPDDALQQQPRDIRLLGL